MTHADPRIQDLVEILQGALKAFGACNVVWYVETDVYGSYTVKGIWWSPSTPPYAMTIPVSPRALESPSWEEIIKHSIVRAALLNVIKTSKPALADEVAYMAAAGEPGSRRI